MSFHPACKYMIELGSCSEDLKFQRAGIFHVDEPPFICLRTLYMTVLQEVKGRKNCDDQ